MSIGSPCGGFWSVTEVIQELVVHRDPVLSELAARHSDTASLARWIRDLPLRSDESAYRLRIPAPDPSSVERASLYVAVAELIDPKPRRRLAAFAMGVIVLEDGAPIVLGRQP